MYICRRCKTSVDETDRFCSGCGAYIGEPAVQKDNWETANDYSSAKLQERHSEIAFESIELDNFEDATKTEYNFTDKDSNKHVLFVIHPEDALGIYLKNLSLISIVKVTALAIISIPLLLSLIIKIYLKVPNDLVDIILPFNLLEVDFKEMLNLPGNLQSGFLLLLTGFSVVSVILFSALYFSARLTLKAEVSVRKLSKALMISLMVYAFSLAVFIAVSFISRTLGNSFLFIGMIFWLFTLYSAVKTAIINIEDKAAIITAASLLFSTAAIYAYLYFFLR